MQFNEKSAKFFKDNSYLLSTGFIDTNACEILYNHVKNNAKRLEWFERQRSPYDEDRWGKFNDTQAPGAFSLYGDPIMDSVLELGTTKLQYLTGIKLMPTYSYHRLYVQNNDLKRHKDRPSCEISATLCLGYDTSNLSKEHKDWNWPMFISKEDGGKGTPLHMKPGDIIVYRGCEVEHWREPYPGLNHAQLFLHYNEIDGQFQNVYDGRPLLGLPASYRNLNKIVD